MAYPEVSGPYGLKPYGLMGGRVNNHAIRHIPIASGYATAIFNGDAVTQVTDGTVERDAADAAMTPMGVFLGCSYTDPDMGFVQRNYWPAGTVAADAVAYVLDDPNALFKVAIVSGTTVIGSMARTDVGANAAMVDNTGSTVTGNSKIALSETSATTATLPLRIVDLVEETKNAAGGYTEAIVKWNAGHQLVTALGV